MTTREASQQLIADLKVVSHDAEELLKATAGDASEKVKDIRKRLGKAVDSAKATCERVQEQTLEVAKSTDQVIREHTYESVGVAFGIGLLIGLLVGSRD